MIIDNEPLAYSFSGATRIIETAGNYDLTLERRGAAFGAITHTYTVVGSENTDLRLAEAESRDFENGIVNNEQGILLEGVFDFGLFANEATITIRIRNDEISELDKQFTVSAAGQQQHVSLEDDDALIDARFSDRQPLTLAEGRTITVPFGFRNLFLRNDNEPGESDNIRVDFRIVPESAEENDYKLPLASVIVLADETSGAVEFMISDDSIYEGEETFRLEIVETQLAGSNTREYDVAERRARGVSVTIQVDPTDLPRFETQPLNGGVQNEGTTYTLQVELVNADADGSPTDLTLAFQSSGTARTIADYQIQPVTIAAARSTTTVEIGIIDDILYEPTETVEFSIVAYSVDGGPAQVHTPTVVHQFEIADRDSPVIRLRTEDGSNRVSETDDRVTLLVVLDNAPAVGSPEVLDIVIDITRSSIATATMGVDYNLETMVQIGRGQTQAEITLQLLDDAIYEVTESIDLYPANIVINGRDYPSGATADNISVITIEDDDFLTASLDLEVSDMSFAESGSATVRIKLDQPFPVRTPAVFRFASTEARSDLLINHAGYVSSLDDSRTIVFTVARWKRRSLLRLWRASGIVFGAARDDQICTDGRERPACQSGRWPRSD